MTIGRAATVGSSITGMTPVQKFERSVAGLEWCIAKPNQQWERVQFLRCSGGTRRDQKFICVVTTRIGRNLFCGGNRLTVLVAFILEEDSKRMRTVNERKEVLTYSHGVSREEQTNLILSCGIERTGTSLSNSQC